MSQPPTNSGSSVSMVFPELRSIMSPDLEPPTLPPDPDDCAVQFQVQIGPRGRADAEAFSFTVVTPTHLARTSDWTWARGLLIMNEFEWRAVVRAVAELLAECAKPSWVEVVAELSRQIRREPARNGQSEHT